MTRPLYAYAYAHVDDDDAIAVLAQDPQGLLQSATDVSMEHADEVVSNLHVEIAGFDLGRDVVVQLDDFCPVEQLRAVVPLHWRAASGQVLFPTVDATLEVAALPLHPPVVQVTLAGAYDPPLGPVGRVLDRALTRSLADAVIHRFVHDVAERLEALVTRAADARLVDVAIAPRDSTVA